MARPFRSTALSPVLRAICASAAADNWTRELRGRFESQFHIRVGDDVAIAPTRKA